MGLPPPTREPTIGILYIDKKTLLVQDDERRRLEVEARQEKERWEEHRREEHKGREEHNRREEHSRRKEHNNREEHTRREEHSKREKEKQQRRKDAFVRYVRQRSGGVIGLINNTGRKITFTSTRFLMERSQVLEP